MNLIEIIRENLNPQQVMKIRTEEKAKGNSVNIRRIHSALVEIEIISTSIIEIHPYKKKVISMTRPLNKQLFQ